MNFKILFLSLLMMGGIESTLSAQTKIGYTNVELIMAYMPEVAQANKDLETFRQQLQNKIKPQQSFYQNKLSQYYEKNESNGYPSEEAKKVAEQELIKLESEIQQLTTQSENQLAVRQQELMNPIMQKIQSKIDEVAREGNFTYILNQTTGNNLLYGLKTMNVTEKLALKLGITIPK